MKTWTEENDDMLELYMNKYLKKINSEKGFKYILELYLTDQCNQKCEYCYLIKHQDELYPKEYRDPDNILKNLEIFLNYLIEKGIAAKNITLFSGEIWHTPFGLKVLNIVLDYCKKTQEVEKDKNIMIPSNFTFILNDKYVETLEKYIDMFESAGARLFFSCSIDGPIIESDNRPFNDESKNYVKKDDAYYKKIIDFCNKRNFGYHPMVNAYSIEKWPEQFKWWIDTMLETGREPEGNVMFLEVRDNNWTFDKINSYLEFINYAIEYKKEKLYNNDIETTLKHLLRMENYYPGTYINTELCRTSPSMNCTVDRAMIVRIGDLSWVPCHRTSYEPFIYGTFKVENNKIIGISAKNLPLLFSIQSLKYKGHPKCDTCSIGPICPRGCFGSQFESNKELFYPCQTVCDLYIAKSLFLYYKIESLLKQYKGNNTTIKKSLEKIYTNCIIQIPKEEKVKWIPKIQQLIMN